MLLHCLVGVTRKASGKTRSVLHTAARLIARRRKYDSITPIIRDSLHWLPIAQRVEYKLCTFVFKCLHEMAPVYLIDMCIPVSTIQGRSQLRSAAHGELVVPRSTRVTFGNRSFSVSGSETWNTLPLNARDFALSFGQFISLLKTVLFNRAYMHVMS